MDSTEVIKSPEKIVIRDAKPEDARSLVDIYKPYVIHTAITFEYRVPTVAEFRNRIHDVMRHYPFLVAESEGKVIGYAYLSAFHPRAAYRWCAECAIYLSEEAQGKGTGRILYDRLEHIAKRMNILNLYACISVPETDDEYLTHNSIHFHSHLGFRQVGEFRNCGYKFHRWYHMVWMEKMIGRHHEDHPDVIWYPELNNFTY